MTNRPEKLPDRVFKQLFDQAEIAQFDDKEYEEYEESLKEYRDLKNSIDTAFNEGINEGVNSKALKVAKKLKELGTPVEVIAEATGLSKAEIETQ